MAEEEEEKKEVSAVRMPVHAFVRVRPVLSAESEAGEKEADWSVLTVKKSDTRKLVISHTERGKSKKLKFAGFKGILRPSHDNAKVFSSCIEPLLPGVIDGQTTCAFAYGHSGSGKSHTILGYDSELGMYHMAASHLCAELAKLRESTGDSSLKLAVSLTDIYCGKVQDLIGGYDCAVREDDSGMIHVRGPTEIDSEGRVSVKPLTAVACSSMEEVLSVVKTELSNRVVSSSTVHDLSSRSHAILEMEIVSDGLLSAREAALSAEADVVPIGKQRDDERVRQGLEFFNALKQRMLDEDETLAEQGEGAIQARVYEALKSLSDEERKALDGGGGEELERLDQEVSRLNGILDEKLKKMIQIENEGPSCLGGRIVLVDLAGNEFASDDSKGKMTSNERTERKSINGSLFALKECIRALHIGSDHVPFRSSKLTMVLRRHLLGEQSTALMIATMSPCITDIKRSKNTLDYAQLIAQA